MKACCRCGLEKQRHEFSAARSNRDGLNSACKSCDREKYVANRAAVIARSKAWAEANPEKFKLMRIKSAGKHRDKRLSRLREYRAANAETLREKRKAWLDENAERVRANAKAWRKRNPDASASLAKKWRATRKHVVCELAARRRATKRSATPAWSDVSIVRDIYKYASIMREAGIDCHVDHHVPLQSRIVCGLHSHTNITVLLADHNIVKSNKFWLDMP